MVLKKENVHGLAIQGSKTFYTTVRELFSADIEPNGDIGNEPRLANDPPDAGQHANRTLGFGPDGMLYLSVGSTCNSCIEANRQNATILRMKPDGSGREIFASGLRNTIGFAWHPENKAL